MPAEVYMPKMSDHMQKGIILKWLAEEGGQVQERQPIAEVETDKAVGEVEAPVSGILRGVRAGEGVEVPVGEVIAFIAQPGEGVPELPPIPSGERAKRGATPPPLASPAARTERVLATPAARRLARELGVSLVEVEGTGPGGRIKTEDVRGYAEEHGAAPTPLQAREQRVLASPTVKATALAAVTPSPPADEAPKWLGLSTIPRSISGRMTWGQQGVSHFVLTVEVDMAEATRLREVLMDRTVLEIGDRLSYTALLAKVVALALRRRPLARLGSPDGGTEVQSPVNIGVTVPLGEGLAVPVIRDADRKGLVEITRELASFQKLSALRSAPQEQSSGMLTIFDLGTLGIDQFSAITSVPRGVILGVGRTLERLSGLENGSASFRPAASLTLSADDRVVDGVAGARFLSEVKHLLENPYLLL